MNRLVITVAGLLFVVCCPRPLMAVDSDIVEDIRTMLDEMEEGMSRMQSETMEQMKEFMTEQLVEPMADLKDMVSDLQEKQKYFEVCLNSYPCGEHGACSVEGDKYKCTCEDGYSGEHCEMGGDICDEVECLNGGMCHSNITGSDQLYMCVCNGTWYGEHCEMQGPCAAAYDAAKMNTPLLLGSELPECESDGFFAPVQFKGSVGYCVTEDGEELPGYTMNRWDADENSTCSCARDEHRAITDKVDSAISCIKNGDYAPFICDRKKCYCQDSHGEVDRSSGVPRRVARRRLKCPGMKGKKFRPQMWKKFRLIKKDD